MMICRTPLRVSLFGGGTDLREYYEQHEGMVVSMTINKYIYVILKPNVFDDSIVLNYFNKERATHVDEIQHGMIRECLKLAGIDKKITITIIEDLPLQGTGLGTSSALAIGLLNALHAYQNKQIDPFQLAEMASHIEIEILRAPIGKQDQYASAFGGFKEYTFGCDHRVHVRNMSLPAGKLAHFVSHLLLFHTGIERQASTVLADQKMKMRQRLDDLHALKAIAKASYEYFESFDMQKIGSFLNESWMHKKKLSEKIQNDVIKEMYHIGMKAGALGGKVLGAGGGGFLCLFCEPQQQAAVKAALQHYKELPFLLEPEGSLIQTFP